MRPKRSITNSLVTNSPISTGMSFPDWPASGPRSNQCGGCSMSPYFVQRLSSGARFSDCSRPFRTPAEPRIAAPLNEPHQAHRHRFDAIIQPIFDNGSGGFRFPMRRRLVLVTLLLSSFIARFPDYLSFAQVSENEPPPVIESPPPASEISPAPVPTDEHRLPELLPHERTDAVLMLSELRSAVRASPDSADDRLRLAQGLYRIGDFDAAIDECRVALKLESNNARAYLQLGITLIAKQDVHAAAAALLEAIQLDPEFTHAHYSLGSVQYSLGNL
ncbi:MAG: tetratricopeptide repeat protein, partial [Nitrospirae bacterium]